MPGLLKSSAVDASNLTILRGCAFLKCRNATFPKPHPHDFIQNIPPLTPSSHSLPFDGPDLPAHNAKPSNLQKDVFDLEVVLLMWLRENYDLGAVVGAVLMARTAFLREG